MADLTKEVNRILNEYVKGVEADMLKIEEDVAAEAVSKLKKSSPKSKHNKKGHYADKWQIDGNSKKNYSQTIIHNKDYQLTHLLEKGHDVVRNGAVVGHTKPQEHIKPVEEWVKDEMVKRMEEVL